MTTHPWLIIVVTALYAAEAARLVWIGNHSGAVLVAGYVVAGIGLAWELWP